ncbi:MAG: UDP-N-acetylglucosamine 2-epimerase (non-hydrolyzing) [Candidatus Aquidulcis sp.]|nr:MAG: UDP-N-acetylglucosamine 2-epimerase (non-hydrolyzing) [Candidatus Aquidulcis sp.]
MRITAIVGTRPQLIKLAALRPHLAAPIEPLVIDTAQHHDELLAGQIYRDLGMTPPDLLLPEPGDLRGTARLEVMVRALDAALAQMDPDAVLVFGDTDSTLAGALAAHARGIPIAHVEAGVRSGDATMPEERNRIAVDKIASLRLCTSDGAVQALREEGLTDGNVVVGDLMADLVARLAPTARGTAALDTAALHIGRSLLSGGYGYATLHRADVREATRLRAALDALRVSAEHLGVSVLFAAHPGTSAAIAAHGIDVPDGVELVPPVGYLDSLALAAHAAAVLTDSGGLQREAVWLLHPAGPSLLIGVDGGRVAAALATVGAVTGAAAVAARVSRPLPAGGAAEAIRAALIARRFAR